MGVGLRVVDYDPDWPRRAEALSAALRQAIPDWFVAIEHIGSTAVPGLAAKPSIDLMAAVAELTEPNGATAALADLGWRSHPAIKPDRLLYVREAGGEWTALLHVVTRDSWDTRNQRILRDYLRAHPAEAARYGALKRELVASGIAAADYAAAKTDLVQELTDHARAERGLPSVSVWETG